MGNQSPRDNRTMEQFVSEPAAKSPLGKLFIELTKEMVWSNEYEISAYLGRDAPYLRIDHPTFLSDRPLIVRNRTKIVSIRDVEDALQAHFRESEESLRPEISRLQNQRDDLYRASDQITVDKAKAAIVSVFPEAADSRHFAPYGRSDLCCFILGHGFGHKIFVAREIDHEFGGGVVELHIPGDEWHHRESGQKHKDFWKALARAFVAREFQIPEDTLYGKYVGVEEKPLDAWAPGPDDPYIVEKVVLGVLGEGQVVVTFGANNLPAEAVLVPHMPEETRVQ